jgi:hypothetical protein
MDPRNDGRGIDVTTQRNCLSAIRTKYPVVGHCTYPRRENEFGEQFGMCSSARLPSRLCTLERGGHRNREAPASECWWAMALSGAPERYAPVTSDAGLSLLTTQCRFFEGGPFPRILVPSSLVVTSAALTPGSLRLESDQEGRWPSSLTRPSAQFEIRDAPPGHTSRGETLQRYRPGRLVPNADSRPPGGSVSRRRS